jgi:hypothetical protein
MAEENTKKTKSKRATKEELLRLITDVVDVDIDGRKFGIRPITYAEDAEIERVASDQPTEDEQMRQRILLTAWKGLVDPKMEMDELGNLPAGLVTKIAIEVGNISAGVAKK